MNHAEIFKASSIFDDKNNAQALIGMLIHLERNTDLSPKEKEEVLNRISKEIPKGKEGITSKEGPAYKTAYMRNIRAVSALIEFNESALLKNSEKPMADIAYEYIRKILMCEDIEDFVNKFDRTFQKTRNPSAIITYAAKIDSLKDPKSSACFGGFVSSTIRGDSRKERYNVDNNPHLKKISEDKNNPLLLAGWMQNQKPVNLDTLEVNPASTVDSFSVKGWMKNKLDENGDNHIPNKIELKLTYLDAYLDENDSEGLKAIEEKLNNEYKNAAQNKKDSEEILELVNKLGEQNKKIRDLNLKLEKFEREGNELEIKRYKGEIQDSKRGFKNSLEAFLKKHPAEKYPHLYELTSGKSPEEMMKLLEERGKFLEAFKSAEEHADKLKFQHACIQWIKAADSEEIKTISEELSRLDPIRDAEKCKTAKSKININSTQIQKSLEDIKEILEKAPFNRPPFYLDIEEQAKAKPVKKDTGDEFVVETDDPIDLLLCGSDVGDSCQSVDYYAHLNKGLLGYMVDGKNKLLAVKGPDGRMRARCLLRLLWDGEKPVLFMEKMYPGKITAKQKQALEMFARKKAEQLNLSLLSLDGKGETYGKSLLALGGPAPWEYCDATGGVTDGKFEILNTKYLN